MGSVSVNGFLGRLGPWSTVAARASAKELRCKVDSAPAAMFPDLLLRRLSHRHLPVERATGALVRTVGAKNPPVNTQACMGMSFHEVLPCGSATLTISPAEPAKQARC
jgi:hypothetical protein